MNIFPVSKGTVQLTGSGDLIKICSGDLTLVGSGGDLTTGSKGTLFSGSATTGVSLGSVFSLVVSLAVCIYYL